MEQANQLSVVILTKNEEKNILACLKNVEEIADEIIIVDDFSSDKTLKIVRKHSPCAILLTKKLANFAKQRNFGAKKAKNKWILNLDCDERLSKKLKKDILIRLKSPDADAYLLSFKVVFPLNKYVWQHKPFLYNKRIFRWEGKIHEQLIGKGKIGRMKNPVYHYEWRNITHWVSKINKYSSLHAESLTKLNKFSYWIIIFRLFIYPPLYFFYWYVWQQHFRNGIFGFIYSVGSSFTQFLKYAKYYEAKYLKPKDEKKD